MNNKLKKITNIGLSKEFYLQKYAEYDTTSYSERHYFAEKHFKTSKLFNSNNKKVIGDEFYFYKDFIRILILYHENRFQTEVLDLLVSRTGRIFY